MNRRDVLFVALMLSMWWGGICAVEGPFFGSICFVLCIAIISVGLVLMEKVVLPWIEREEKLDG